MLEALCLKRGIKGPSWIDVGGATPVEDRNKVDSTLTQSFPQKKSGKDICKCYCYINLLFVCVLYYVNMYTLFLERVYR